jgi:hypothetical protein
MTYDAITTAAFVPAPRDSAFLETPNALTFPRHWRDVVLDLYRHGKSNPERLKQIPIRRLNGVIEAFAPDLLSVAKRATFDDTRPWLYTTSPYPASIIKSLILSWLHDLQPKPENFHLVRDAEQQLAPGSLEWDLVAVDMLEQQVSAGGTALPAPHLYDLLPDILADRIAALDPYEHNGEKVTFRRVATDQPGAELMSWPPLARTTTSKENGTRTWSYSASIHLTLQTVPFSPVPRIHIDTGIRRWIRGPVWMPADRSVSVYLLADSPWLLEAPQSSRFAVGKLNWSRNERKVVWKASGPEGILRRLSVNPDFPQADVLAKRPEEWLDRIDGVRAAVTYQTMMGFHGVGAGLMPSERRRLTDWAAAALDPDFRRIGDLERSDLKATPSRVLRRSRPVPLPKNDPTGEKTAKATADNTEITAANALTRRALVADTLTKHLRCHLLYQTDECRDELIRAAEDSLGLHTFRIPAPAGTWAWKTPDELHVTLSASPLGPLGAALGGATPPRGRQQIDDAISERRTAVRDRVNDAAGTAQVVFVELDGRKTFNVRSSDPKFAIRLGCADAGRVSQFLTPFRKPSPAEAIVSTEEAVDDEQEDSNPHRADAAWADGLRQLGVRFVPTHTLGEAIPDPLNQLAFWMIKRRSDGPWFNPQFTPIAVLIRPNQNSILGRTADMDSWVPYPDLLRALTGRIRSADLKTRPQQQAEAARFIRKVLFGLRNEQTLLVTHANNSRAYVPWLQNSITIADMFQLGGGPVQRLALQGRLRLVRLRGHDRGETPQWWVAKDPGKAGLAKGLWKPGKATTGDRVFYSTMDKSSTHHIALDATKLTTHVKTVTIKDKKTGEESYEERSVIESGKNAWNPSLLEIAVLGLPAGEDPETWAMYLHQQRQTDDNRDGLALPLILHLAQLADEYALPHEDPVQASADDEPTDTPVDADNPTENPPNEE